MLPERDCRLLTAYVDGELDKRQRNQVLRLLRRSPEARLLLRRLLRDSRTLEGLTVPALTVDLTDTILGTIASRRLQPGKARVQTPAPVVRAFPAWAGLAAAAAVLLVVGLGSFLYFLPSPGPTLDPEPYVAENPGTPTRGEQENPPGPPNQVTREDKLPVAPTEEPEPKVPPLQRAVSENPVVRILPGEDDDPPAESQPETPPQARRDVLGSSGREGLDRIEKVEAVVPVVVRIHDLDGVLQREKFLAGLQQGGIFRVELLCRDATRAVERVRPALTRKGITLQVDTPAQARLKKPNWKSDYGLFVENISAAELVELLMRVGVADRKAQASKPGDGRFDGPVVIAPLSRRERRDLNEMLAVELVRTATVNPPLAPTAVDVRRPLPESTAEQVAAALQGQGPPRPGASDRSGPNQALLVHLAGPRSRPTPEVKRFQAARKAAQPGTLQIFLVLRNIGS
jgi:hypothetical protein